MSESSLLRKLRKTPMRDMIRGRLTGRLDIDRLLEDSGLSGKAADTVRRVVKRTRLWRLEKVDVAKELIAHFLDGQEAGVSQDELLERFGDEKQVARLIRRAKKRQRPLAWHVFAWTRLGVGCLFGMYVLSALYLMTGSPSVKVDYLAVLNRRAASVPAEEAAWPLYREALLTLNMREQRQWDTPIPFYAENPDHPDAADYLQYGPPYRYSRWQRIEQSDRPDKPGWSATVAFLEENAGALELIRRAASKPGQGFVLRFEEDLSPADLKALDLDPPPANALSSRKTFRDPDRNLMGARLPHLGHFRSLARLLRMDTARAVEAGDAQTAYENVRAILGLARHTDEHPLLITGLVRLSIQVLAYETIQETLQARPDLWSDEQLSAIAHHLAAIKVNPADWYNGDRLWFYDTLQRIYTDDGRGDGHITEEGLLLLPQLVSFDTSLGHSAKEKSAAIAKLPAMAMLMASRKDMRQTYDALMDLGIAELQKPLWETAGTSEMEQRFRQMTESPLQWTRYFLFASLMPALAPAHKTIEHEAGRREGVMTGVALELYRRQHGAWPDSLDALVPRYLPAVPVDRLTGKPVRYKVTDAGPVVYSVGVDGDDDGGRPPIGENGKPDNQSAGPRSHAFGPPAGDEPDGDWLLWPMPEDD
ncbi:MAG: hypothetical protein Kow00105_00570 [Phycisphaeraceae bacterium]